MFEELRDLATTVREHAPVVVEELQRAVESIVIAAESLARIADRLDAGKCVHAVSFNGVCAKCGQTKMEVPA